MNTLGFEGQVISTCGNSHGNLPLLLQRQNKKPHTLQTKQTNIEMPPKNTTAKMSSVFLPETVGRLMSCPPR